MTISHFDHKKPHFSASQINAFIESPGSWVLSYLYGYKLPVNDAMREGSFLESVITDYLLKDDFIFTDYTLTQQQIAIVADTGRSIGKISKNQKIDTQVLVNFEKQYSDFPIIGYIDYATNNTIIDLKITKRAPNTEPPPSHIRQIVIYQMIFDNVPKAFVPGLALVYGLKRQSSPHSLTWVSDEDLAAEFDVEDIPVKVIPENLFVSARLEIKHALKQMQRIKTLFDDNGFAPHVPFDPHHFRLKDYDRSIIDGFMDGTLKPFEPENPF